jgi:rare lipoprotein A
MQHTLAILWVAIVVLAAGCSTKQAVSPASLPSDKSQAAAPTTHTVPKTPTASASMLAAPSAATAPIASELARATESGNEVVTHNSASPVAPALSSYRPALEAITGWSQQGIASWYGPGFHGKRTANGERFDTQQLTAAHKTLPFGSRVRVTSLINGKQVIVRINDRGPFITGRIIDLSRAAAQVIGLAGVKQVRIEQLEPTK